ncbi:MAG: Stp1/IreP family PP2C-type Ser/Thr phosphatase [Bacilli bacterium]|nr:Stp1/IreP family PP2C-type Ser/Thr phosphatase [Bacilli bacterium]
MKNKFTYQNDFAYQVDVGKVRIKNDDQALILTNSNDDVLMIIADGMGGHSKGDYASKLTIDILTEEFKKHKKGFISIFVAKLWLQYVVGKANKLVYNTAEKDKSCKGMGTTLVALLIRKNNIVVLNVGDSRAYIYHNDKIERLSEDESYVDYLKRSGQISESEAEKRKDKNVLLNALGIYPSISFNSRLLMYHNEPLLLCSDGLFNNLKEKDIAAIIKKGMDTKLTVKELINAANRNGGSDNIAVAYFVRRQHD